MKNMNNGIMIIVIIVIALLLYFVGTGTVSAQSFVPKKNNIATLTDVVSQKDAPLLTAQSTQGLNGFADPNPPNDPASLQQNILTKDLVSEDVIRNLYNQTLSAFQVNVPTGSGQGTQTKTISAQDAMSLFNIKNTSAFTKSLANGSIKLVQDPTSGLTSVALTQETVNKAKTDPKLANILTILQNKGLVGSG